MRTQLSHKLYRSQGYKNGCNVALKIKEPHVDKNT